MDTLKQFKKSLIAAVLGLILYIAIMIGLLGPAFNAVLVVELLAFGVLFVYEAFSYVLRKTT